MHLRILLESHPLGKVNQRHGARVSQPVPFRHVMLNYGGTRKLIDIAEAVSGRPCGAVYAVKVIFFKPFQLRKAEPVNFCSALMRLRNKPWEELVFLPAPLFCDNTAERHIWVRIRHAQELVLSAALMPDWNRLFSR